MATVSLGAFVDPIAVATAGPLRVASKAGTSFAEQSGADKLEVNDANGGSAALGRLTCDYGGALWPGLIEPYGGRIVADPVRSWSVLCRCQFLLLVNAQMPPIILGVGIWRPGLLFGCRVLLGRGLLACCIDGQAAVLQFLPQICDALLCGCKALYDPPRSAVRFVPDCIVVEIDHEL